MPRHKKRPKIVYAPLPDDSVIDDVFDYVFRLILEDDSV